MNCSNLDLIVLSWCNIEILTPVYQTKLKPTCLAGTLQPKCLSCLAFYRLRV